MKTARFLVTMALLLFVGATVGTLIAQEVTRPEARIGEEGESAAETSETAPLDEPGMSTVDASDVEGSAEAAGDVAALTAQAAVKSACVVDVIYFHNTQRCWTCQEIEREARTIVEEEFAAEVAAETLRWSAINMEEERAYISQYDLAMPSLVLVRRVGDEVVDWIALNDTWSLIRSKTRFSMYIVDSLRAFLEACP